ncbi:MAG: tetratricopeptide repeat protein [Bacteroidetes bacterium]|nr:tetratricopeptide repeat protein [Bacteroidota bacterium]
MEKILIAASLFICSISFAQQINENVTLEGLNHQITISTLNHAEERKSYEGTNSNEALQYYNEGTNYAFKNDFDNCKKYYLMALQIDSEFVQAYDNLGVLYRRLGDYEKAIEKYKQSIRFYPMGKVAHQNLASVYSMIKQFRNAGTEYETLIKLDSTDPEGYFGYANLNMEELKYDSALKNAKMALKLYEKQNSTFIAEGQYLIGLIYYYKQDNDNAIKYLRIAKKNGAEISADIAKALRL